MKFSEFLLFLSGLLGLFAALIIAVSILATCMNNIERKYKITAGTQFVMVVMLMFFVGLILLIIGM